MSICLVLDFFLHFQAVKVEHCERVQVIVAANRICIATCRESLLFLGVTQRPLILGDNHNLKVDTTPFIIFLENCTVIYLFC